MLLSSCLTFLHFQTQVALLISKVSTRPCPCMEYYMCKSVDKKMRIGEIRLTHKSGGNSGTFDAE